MSPAGGKLRAIVDEKGGNALAYPLQGLRFRADWLDPHVAASFLESPRNRRFATGTTYGYARVRAREKAAVAGEVVVGKVNEPAGRPAQQAHVVKIDDQELE